MDSLTKIIVKGDIVEIEGDEMAQVMWQQVKQKLILPFLQLSLKTHNLSQKNRQQSKKAVEEAVKAVQEYKVAVKCPTLTTETQCPANIIMNAIAGTSFTEPLDLKNIPRLVSGWKKPIIIARHCYGDQYKAVEIEPKDGKFSLVFQGKSGKTTKWDVFDFKNQGGVAMAFSNTDQEIRQFAQTCLKYALYKQLPLYFTTKNTILKRYDGRFKDTFSELYNKTYKKLYQSKKIWYQHRLIDDMVAYMMKSDGGYVWACKNYDGDVENNCIAQGYGSQALAVSIQMGTRGQFLVQPIHGTVSRHYKEHLKGKETSSNPTGIILTWCRALSYRAKLDENAKLTIFAKTLESSVVETIQKGYMTKDLAGCIHQILNVPLQKFCSTSTFIDKIGDCLRQKLNNAKI